MAIGHVAWAKARSEYQARFEELLARVPSEDPARPLRLAPHEASRSKVDGQNRSVFGVQYIERL